VFFLYKPYAHIRILGILGILFVAHSSLAEISGRSDVGSFGLSPRAALIPFISVPTSTQGSAPRQPVPIVKEQPVPYDGHSRTAAATPLHATHLKSCRVPFLRHSFLFDANSLELSTTNRSMLKRAAARLREHYQARVLIVGTCDRSGSEACTRAFAESREGSSNSLFRFLVSTPSRSP